MRNSKRYYPGIDIEIQVRKRYYPGIDIEIQVRKRYYPDIDIENQVIYIFLLAPVSVLYVTFYRKKYLKVLTPIE